MVSSKDSFLSVNKEISAGEAITSQNWQLNLKSNVELQMVWQLHRSLKLRNHIESAALPLFQEAKERLLGLALPPLE